MYSHESCGWQLGEMYSNWTQLWICMLMSCSELIMEKRDRFGRYDRFEILEPVYDCVWVFSITGVFIHHQAVLASCHRICKTCSMSEKQESRDSCVCTLSSVGHTLTLDASVCTCRGWKKMYLVREKEMCVILGNLTNKAWSCVKVKHEI